MTGGLPASFLDEIEEGQRLRGWVTNSYAQIEFMLGDLILRAREFPEYAEHTQTLPYDAPRRVKRVRQILKIVGPLATFSGELISLMDRFEIRHDTRNLLAHGFCEFLYTPEGDTGLQFQKWHRVPDRIDGRMIRCFRLRDLKREAEEMVQLAQNGLTLFHRIHAHFQWVGEK